MSNLKNNQEKSLFSTLIQLAVGLYLMFIGGQSLFAQTSDQSIKFDNLNGATVTFGGYWEDIYRITNNRQTIHLSPESLEKLGEALEKVLQKANEWYDIAQENSVKTLDKEIPVKGYTTDGGYIYDSGNKSTDDKDEFKFKFSKYEDRASISIEVFQMNGVYSNFFRIGSICIKDCESSVSSRLLAKERVQLEKLNNFIVFAKNNKSILDKKINSTKQDLFN